MAGPEWKMPAKLRHMMDTAVDAGRSLILAHGIDSGDHPYVALTVKWDNHEVRATWHTRATGSYRLFSAIARYPHHPWHDVTADRAIELIRDSGGEA